MASDIAKPSYNAKRRIQFLFGFSIFLIIAASAGWFFVAGKIDEEAGKAIAAQRTQGLQIDCPNRDVKGYPFRFGVFCDSISVAGGSRGPSFTAGAVRSAAQFYDPTNIIVEIDGPAALSLAGGQSIDMSWSLLRASSVVAQPIPQTASIVSDDFKLTHPDGDIRAERVEAHMRQVSADLDVAGRVAALEFENDLPQLVGLPPLAADFDITLADGVALASINPINLRGTNGEVRRMAVLLNPDRGVLLNGPFSVDDNGLIDAEITVRIVDVDAVFDVLKNAVPNVAPMLSAFADGQPRTGEKGDEVELKISIVSSQVRLGFIPLGKLKPL